MDFEVEDVPDLDQVCVNCLNPITAPAAVRVLIRADSVWLCEECMWTMPDRLIELRRELATHLGMLEMRAEHRRQQRLREAAAN